MRSDPSFGGALGSLALVLAKRWAQPVLWASLLGLVGQDAGMLSQPGGIGAIGTVPVVLQTIVLLIAVALVVLARTGIARRWLN